MPRKRKRPPLLELLAAALSLQLPQAERDQLRGERVPAKRIVSMFTPDHIVLHAWGGSDRWWNLDMRRRGPELKLKDAVDTGRAAKVVRLDDTWRSFTRAMAKGKKPPKRRSRWARRRMR